MIAGRMYGFDAIPSWMVEGLQWSEHLIEVGSTIDAMQIMIRDKIFKYEDGSLDTSDDELRVRNDKINKVLNPMPGKIYIIDGIRSLCLAINASYGEND